MAKQHYVAVLERGPASGFGVFFPDLPGCVTAGDTAEEAMANAQEALELHIEGMVAEGMAIPPATSVHAFGAEDFPESDIATLFWVAVETPAPAPTDQPERINVSLPKSLVQRIDTAADANGMTRSGLLAIAARQWIAAHTPRSVGR